MAAKLTGKKGRNSNNTKIYRVSTLLGVLTRAKTMRVALRIEGKKQRKRKEDKNYGRSQKYWDGLRGENYWGGNSNRSAKL